MKWKNLIMPKSVELDEGTFSDRYGRFIAEPLERGFGNTLGNALRRVLLSSLQGAAITSLKIDTVLHEFSTIPGIVEDVTEVVLNMKEVRIKLHTNHTKKVVVEMKGPGDLNAVAFQTDTDIEILNPDHHIATLSDDADLRMEVTISAGHGYVPAELNKKQEQPIGTIPIDAIFTPVTKVNYSVESTRVGQRIDYDKLFLDIWTDGTITPDDALATAARILRDHLKLFISFEEEPEEVEIEEVDEETIRIRNLLKMSVEELELSVRSSNCLKAAEIKTLSDLVQKTEAEMLKYRNFGRKSLQELNEILNNMGLSFGMNVSRYLEKPSE